MDKWTDGSMDEQKDGWMDGLMGGSMDEQKDGRMDGWMDGWMDKCVPHIRHSSIDL